MSTKLQAQSRHPKAADEKAVVSLPQRMVMSALAGMGGSTCCHPLDVLKFQLQMDMNRSGGDRMYKGTFDCAKQIVQRSGIQGLYAGLSAAYLRQWMYGSGRMGIYSYLFNDHKEKHAGAAPTLLQKLRMGATSGSVGAFIGTPADVALVRMSADSKKPLAERANYKHVVDCLARIVKADGVLGLYKGAPITMARAAVLSSCQMGMTSQTREVITGYDVLDPKGLPIMVCSSAVASLFACSFSLPIDVIKSRYQNAATGQYTGVVDCFASSIKADGPLVLWRGFTPALFKLTPYTVISLTLLEKITSALTGASAV